MTVSSNTTEKWYFCIMARAPSPQKKIAFMCDTKFLQAKACISHVPCLVWLRNIILGCVWNRISFRYIVFPVTKSFFGCGSHYAHVVDLATFFNHFSRWFLSWSVRNIMRMHAKGDFISLWHVFFLRTRDLCMCMNHIVVVYQICFHLCLCVCVSRCVSYVHF